MMMKPSGCQAAGCSACSRRSLASTPALPRCGPCVAAWSAASTSSAYVAELQPPRIEPPAADAGA